jgi:hypothetical protein
MKNIISEITQEEKNRILEMHRKSTNRLYLSEEETTPSGTGGPLVGIMVSRADGGTYNWGDTVEFKFPGLKNAGQAPIVVNQFMGSSDNMTSSLKLPMTVPAGGNTGPFSVMVRLELGGTTTRPDVNDLINYDVPAYLVTDGKKPKYQIYCRGEFRVR